MKKILTIIFYNSWMKMIYFLVLCVGLTYFVVTNYSEFFFQLFDWRKKETWIHLAIIIPILFLIPIFLNSFYFLKIIQIENNTKQQNHLMEKQNLLLEQLLIKLNKNY